MKLHNTVLAITIFFFIVIAYLSGFGPLTFGAGLGDLAYFFLIILWVIILGVYFLIIRLKNIVFKPIVSNLLIVIFIGSISITILEFTHLRGAEYPWDGRIFMMSHEEYLKIEKEKLISQVNSLEQITLINPKDYKSQTKQGYLLNELENWDKAIEIFDKAIETNPKYFDAHYGLGESYCGKYQYALAVNAFERAKLIDSTRRGVNERIINLKDYHKIK
jgi:tetratricopeptide (TPR) repeat protein